MKYLLNHYGYEHSQFYGFESDKSIKQLKKELDLIIANTKMYDEFVFEKKTFFKNSIDGFRFMTLDNFWKESLKRKY